MNIFNSYSVTMHHQHPTFIGSTNTLQKAIDMAREQEDLVYMVRCHEGHIIIDQVILNEYGSDIRVFDTMEDSPWEQITGEERNT